MKFQLLSKDLKIKLILEVEYIKVKKFMQKISVKYLNC
jgi:hypothetical protein